MKRMNKEPGTNKSFIQLLEEVIGQKQEGKSVLEKYMEKNKK